MLTQDNLIFMGKGDAAAYLLPNMANRHGLIAGATGTGKTITLKVMAEAFSELGVPVFLADVKGDLSGMCKPGIDSEALQKRLRKLGVEHFSYKSFPTRFFDVYGEGGHPVRTTVSEMGPMLLSRLLDLTNVQEGVLNIVFRVADDKGWLLIDMKDLRAMLQYVGEHAADYTIDYGNVSRQSVGAIQRALLALEDSGGDRFFGEPALDIRDWMTLDEDGRGYINVLHCQKLFQNPLLYSTFLLWLLTELFENLPEAGDLEKPKLVFFFDEAHLLFDDAPKVLVQKVEQVVKLIRSKGVGVYFISQSPSDLPDSVLAQLGNRVQHALRAYTPAEQKAVRTAAQTFRPNPAFSTEDAIMDLGTGEALVSFLDAKGRPGIVERAMILPPQSFMGAIDDARRENEIMASDLYGKYETAVDRESAYELIRGQKNAAAQTDDAEPEETEKAPETNKNDALTHYASESPYSSSKRKKGETAEETVEVPKKSAARSTKKTTARKRTNYVEKAANSAVNTIGREIGRKLTRGILGLLKF